MSLPIALCSLALTVALTSAAGAAEQVRLSGSTVTLWNLAGLVIVEPGTGPDVVVSVERGGRDAGKLRLVSDRTPTGSRLRVLYDSDRVVYRRTGWGAHSQSTVRLNDDGTWGGRDRLRGRRVSVASSGRGLEAHADLRVQVPRGRRLEIHVAAGECRAADLDADLSFDGGAAPFSSSGTRGALSVDVGSGAVKVSGHDGDLLVDTGSGSVHADDVRGARVSLDTGSGSVAVRGVRCDELKVDTGSGAVTAEAVDTGRLHVDTGSGAVAATLRSSNADVVIDTGSGGVRLMLPEDFGAQVRVSTGSGGIRTDLPMQVVQRDRDSLVGRLGDGSSRVVIDTGSGGVQILRAR